MGHPKRSGLRKGCATSGSWSAVKLACGAALRMGKYLGTQFAAFAATFHWRYRLGVQDAALSRQKPGFESRYRYQIELFSVK